MVVEKKEGMGLIEDKLTSFDVRDETDIKAVSKELFSSEDIDVKTEVSYDEINMISKIRFLEHKFGIKNVGPLLKSFLSLRVSLARKSRKEFITGIRGEDANQQEEDRRGLMRRWLGK